MPWLVGKMFTFADIGLTPYVYRLVEMGLQGMWSDRPHVAGWLERIMKRPSFEEAIGKYPGGYMEDADEKENAADWAEVKKSWHWLHSFAGLKVSPTNPSPKLFGTTLPSVADGVVP